MPAPLPPMMVTKSPGARCSDTPRMACFSLIMGIEENLAMALRRGKQRGLGWGITAAEREDYRGRLAAR